MKKILLVLILAMLLSAGARTMEAASLFANIGFITDDKLSFDPFLWYLGANMDFGFANILFLSPEANVVTSKFKFNDFFLEPSLLLNVRLAGFFAGAGVTKFFRITGDQVVNSSDWLLKLNVGLTGGNVRWRLYADMTFNNLFKNMLVGMQVGIGI